MFKDKWNELRITLLLYLLILIVPIGAYLSYRSYKEVRDTTAMLHIMMQVPESLLIIEKSDKLGSLNEESKKNLSNLKVLKKWIVQHKNDRDYVGGGNLLKQYDYFEQCLNDFLKSNDKNGKLLQQCIKQVHSLIFALDRMVLLKEQRFENTMFVIVAGVIFFLLLGVYLVRLSIELQIKHRAEMTLYNGKFIQETFKKMCAQSKRYGHQLTIMRIRIKGFGGPESSVSDKEKESVLHRFGTTVWKQIRDSDIFARTEENSFILLLPETPAKKTTVVEQRIRKQMGDTLSLDFEITEIGEDQSCESILKKYF